MAIHDLRAKRATTFDAFAALGRKKDFSAADQPEFDRLGKEVATIDAEIKREQEIIERSASTAVVVAGQEHKVWAQPNDDPWRNDDHAKARNLGTSKGLVVGGLAGALARAGNNPALAAQMLEKHYGARHAVTEAAQKSLVAGIGASGGFIIPPEYVNEIIELLRPRAVVRAAGPRVMPMPRGTMTLPAQTSAASANYGGEVNQISTSQQTLGQIIASFKKLTALVPIGNDLLRYADPAADAFVRDDLAKVIALREDLSFILADGSGYQPQGFLSFAMQYAVQQGGSAGRYTVAAATPFSTQLGWETGAANSSVAASGGNIISSNETPTLSTTVAELGQMVNLLDTANVLDIKRRWFFHPRVYNYLYNLLNSLGLYVYRDELDRGVLLGYPFSKSTQIPINVNDAGSGNQNCTFIFLVEMDDALLLDSMSLEVSVFREGAFYDLNSNLVSLMQTDQTAVRAITEHDFQMRHVASIAVNQFVTWAPTAI